MGESSNINATLSEMNHLIYIKVNKITFFCICGLELDQISGINSPEGRFV